MQVSPRIRSTRVFGHETINGGAGAQIFGGGHTLINGGNGNLDQLRGHDTYVGGQFADSININGDSHASVQGGVGDLDINIGCGQVGKRYFVWRYGELIVAS